MKLIPTDKPSKIGRFVDTQELILRSGKDIPRGENVNIYITSEEEIKEGYYGLIGNEVGKIILTEDGYEFLIGKGVSYEYGDFYYLQKVCKKIILTTDQDLIKDGVQGIDDEFLEWFVKNPSCQYGGYKDIDWDKIIIPKEEHISDEAKQRAKNYMSLKGALEPKQETLEEAAERIYDDNLFNYEKYRDGFIEGAKWQAERMYSEEEVHKILCKSHNAESTSIIANTLKKWLEQFKKK